MPIENPVFKEIVNAITPVVSIGVGSAVCSVCTTLQLNPNTLTKKDLPPLKAELSKHYEKFWSNKMKELSSALARL